MFTFDIAKKEPRGALFLLFALWVIVATPWLYH